MTIIDHIFQEVAGISIPHFFITVEFAALGSGMPEHLEAFYGKSTRRFFKVQAVVNLSIGKENGD